MLASPPARLTATRADDAGSSRSANRAILDCCARGIIRNVSAMASGPHFEDAAELLRDLQNVDLGFHVALNCEWQTPRWGPVAPVESVPSLVDAGGHLLRAPQDLNERGASLDEIMIEVEAQLARLRAAGLPLRYLDEHMGVGWLPGLRQKLSELAARENLIDAGGDAVRRSMEQMGARLLVLHPTYDDAEMRAFAEIGKAPGQIARERDAERLAALDEELLRAEHAGEARFLRYSQLEI